MPNNAQKHHRREMVARKHEAIQNAKALLQTWEPLEAEHFAYVQHLRRKHRRLEIQLMNMGEET